MLNQVMMDFQQASLWQNIYKLHRYSQETKDLTLTFIS